MADRPEPVIDIDLTGDENDDWIKKVAGGYFKRQEERIYRRMVKEDETNAKRTRKRRSKNNTS